MTNTVPGVRARDIPSPFPRTMTDRTTIGELLSSAKAADILHYIHEHPCCKRSDVYHEVSKGSYVRQRIDILVSNGLIDPDAAPFLELTKKGDWLVRALEEIDWLLSTSENST